MVIFVGQVDIAAAQLIVTAAASAFGLVPLALVILQMRVFYAGNDDRTPALINGGMVATKVVVIVVAAALLPSPLVVTMLGLARRCPSLSAQLSDTFCCAVATACSDFTRLSPHCVA
jgi:peptidoglycan biosynthesis protein MviN/MurJ (putative lipid II flippase)